VKIRFFWLLLVCITFTQTHAGVNFIMEFKPGSMLISPDMDGFVVNKSSGWVSYEERLEGFGSFLPGMNLGIGVSVPVIYIDITGRVGLLANGGIIGPFYGPDLAVRFKLGRFFTLGPHIGMLFMNPNWNGENSDSDDISLTADTGVNTGLCFTAGHPKVGFTMTIDYVNQKFTVDTFNDWYGPGEIDMSGFSLNLGVYVRL
jgi:hypothetical protein